MFVGYMIKILQFVVSEIKGRTEFNKCVGFVFCCFLLITKCQISRDFLDTKKNNSNTKMSNTIKTEIKTTLKLVKQELPE
jgi:hypothetical protein